MSNLINTYTADSDLDIVMNAKTSYSHRESNAADIITLLKEGDQRGMELIYDSYYDYLCNVAYKVVKDSEYSEDIVQELLCHVWNKREELEINISLGAYLKKATVNRSLNLLRKKHLKVVDYDLPTTVADSCDNGQRLMEKGEFESFVHQSIQTLPPRCREVFTLSRFEEMTYQEIANSLKISTKTVENHIAKALRYLRLSILPTVALDAY